MAKINMRRRYDLYLSNTKSNRYGAGPYDLEMPEAPAARGTPRQLLEEVREFARISGGCDIAAVIRDPRTGEEFGRQTLEDAVSLADIDAAIRRVR